jgi:hypothetical protein
VSADSHVLRQVLREVDDELVLTLGVDHFHLVIAVDEPALVAHLATAFGVKGRAVQHDLELVAAFPADLAVAQDVGCGAELIVADEGGLAFAQFDPNRPW